MIIYDNLEWLKYDKDGHYQKTICGKTIRLHQYVYQKEQAKLKQDYDIHHLDGDKENNNIKNLVQIPTKLHRWIHAIERKYTNETIKKFSDSKKGKKYAAKKVVQVDTGIIFNSLTDATKFMKLKSPSSITMACKGIQKKAAGFSWEYVEEAHN